MTRRGWLASLGGLAWWRNGPRLDDGITIEPILPSQPTWEIAVTSGPLPPNSYFSVGDRIYTHELPVRLIDSATATSEDLLS